MQAKYECGFDMPVDNSHLLQEHLVNLRHVKEQIAELNVIKEKIERAILIETDKALFDDKGKVIAISKEGQETFPVGRFKVTITTNCNYKIDINKYEELKEALPGDLNPVRTQLKYELNKAKYKVAMTHSNCINLLKECVSFDYAKPSIKVEDNV